jgi:hypothetical protein
VVAARDLALVGGQLEDALGVHDPFHDVGVGHFGLANAVYCAGDSFIEIVSPVREDTAAGRYIDRRGGDCGYMAMFELNDAAAARERLNAAGVRVIFESVHDDIVDLHLHPKDVPAAIVALDVTDPSGSWRWGGPAWTAQIPEHGDGGLRGLTVAAGDPDAAARRWAQVIGIAADGRTLVLDGGRQRIEFVDAEAPAEEGITAVALALPGVTTDVDVAGVRFTCQPTEE